MFGDQLTEAEYGKAKELCVRLYPDVFERAA